MRSQWYNRAWGFSLNTLMNNGVNSIGFWSIQIIYTLAVVFVCRISEFLLRRDILYWRPMDHVLRGLLTIIPGGVTGVFRIFKRNGKNIFMLRNLLSPRTTSLADTRSVWMHTYQYILQVSVCAPMGSGYVLGM